MNSSFQADDFSILVVDDISENIQIIGSILLQQGYQVSYALSGPEALSMVKAKHYDLILLDILMPVMDGYEVCTQLKKDDKSRDLPVIFLTAKTDPISIVKGFKLGAVDYLGKPFNSEELLARVKTQLQLQKQKSDLENCNRILEEKVSERTRELEEAHKELAVLENAKSNFLMLIGHEMRTPLNVLNGFIEELQTSLYLSEHKESIRFLKQSSDKLIDLADSALLITELQSGKYKLRFSSINIRDICESSIESFSDEIITKSIEVAFKFNDDALIINVDFNLVSRCIRNLIHNAIKYSPQGGQIIFKTDKTGSFIKFQIKDKGPGFSKELLVKHFKLFGKDKVDTENEGFGLDLASARLIMDIHSGAIKISNAPDGGALVSLSFPA
jgi:two-component system sensor histidine kinase/response regulator